MADWVDAVCEKEKADFIKNAARKKIKKELMCMVKERNDERYLVLKMNALINRIIECKISGNTEGYHEYKNILSEVIVTIDPDCNDVESRVRRLIDNARERIVRLW